MPLCSVNGLFISFDVTSPIGQFFRSNSFIRSPYVIIWPRLSSLSSTFKTHLLIQWILIHSIRKIFKSTYRVPAWCRVLGTTVPFRWRHPGRTLVELVVDRTRKRSAIRPVAANKRVRSAAQGYWTFRTALCYRWIRENPIRVNPTVQAEAPLKPSASKLRLR